MNLMKHIFLFLILVLTLHLGSVRFFDEYLLPGQELGMVVNILNYNDDDLDNVRLTIYMPGLGFYYRSGTFDVENNDVYGKLVYDSVPGDAEPGVYLAKVTISNDDFRESEYRFITIV